MRIVSLLPSATEICFALGLENELVGVTHECDYPAAASLKPKITRSKASEDLSSSEIDLLVRSQLDETGSIYALDLEALANLKPDLILTQRLCTVCAVSFDYVAEQAAKLTTKPNVVNLEPRTLDEVFDSIVQVGELAGSSNEAREYVASLKKRAEKIAVEVKNFDTHSVLFLEWADPPFASGHWIPELIERAGGANTKAFKHFPSRQISWQDVNDAKAAIIVLAECGFAVARQMQDAATLLANLTYAPKEIWIADGSQYFSRPGPRLVESLQILAGIFHPEVRELYLAPFLSSGEVRRFL
ncbi:MAG: cobalamin-binding protein [Bacteroidota bacterium]|nr:cobalamin-binding protein [Bacteroidota bacterium]MDP4231259.1 cobalamin-binding protein [Bacteroidota bacterium]